MLDTIERLRWQIEQEIPSLTSAQALEAFRLQHLARKGSIAHLFDQLRDVPREEKRQVGQALNALRTLAESAFNQAESALNGAAAPKGTGPDVSLPGRQLYSGSLHPISRAMATMTGIFVRMGFSVATGPHIEDDYHNFEALNFPPDHPARDMQDTFFIADENREDLLLRTHTTPVQIRLLQSQSLPIRAIMPGRVYRNEAVSARAGAEFHQIDGVYVDRDVTMAQLKGTLLEFARAFYGRDIRYQFRPSFFPFTEPSAELDISCLLCGGSGCRVCKYSGWLEILGCGMVHPNVLRACNIDPEAYSGYAFGMGIERTLMLRIGLDDLRLLYENDIRLLEQFA